MGEERGDRAEIIEVTLDDPVAYVEIDGKPFQVAMTLREHMAVNGVKDGNWTFRVPHEEVDRRKSRIEFDLPWKDRDPDRTYLVIKVNESFTEEEGMRAKRKRRYE